MNAAPPATPARAKSLAGALRSFTNSIKSAEAQNRRAEAQVARHNAKVEQRQREGVRWHVRRVIKHVSKFTDGDEDRAVVMVQECLARMHDEANPAPGSDRRDF